MSQIFGNQNLTKTLASLLDLDFTDRQHLITAAILLFFMLEQFRGIIDFARLNLGNKPIFDKLKRIGQTVSHSFTPLEFLPTKFYKLAYS
jgi:hypothetical protein